MMLKYGDQVYHRFEAGIWTILEVTDYVSGGSPQRRRLVSVTNQRERFSSDEEYFTIVDPSVEEKEALAILGEEYFA